MYKITITYDTDNDRVDLNTEFSTGLRNTCTFGAYTQSMRESDNRLKREGSGLEHNYSHAGFLEEGAKLSHAYDRKLRLLMMTS